MNPESLTRPPLTSLACVNLDCDLYGQKGGDNLKIRKTYGRDKIRYLRCQHCQSEFSERKNTALWNSKIPEAKAIAVSEHLAEGCSFKGTARMVKVDSSTVRRLNDKIGQHGQRYHEQEVQEVAVTELQGDERFGFVGRKKAYVWEAELIDPKTRFVLSHEQGPRNEKLIRTLLEDGASRVQNKHEIALFTDGLPAYRTLFPEIFGRAYTPKRQGHRGRPPKVRYRIPRTAAHVQIVKHRSGQRLNNVEVRYVHGSRKRIEKALRRLSHQVPNTSTIERRNGTARLMSAAQVRKTLAFAKRSEAKMAMGWWAVTVYNWCRSHRSLKIPLSKPVGKKSTNSERLPWLLVWRILFYQWLRFFSLPFTRLTVGDNLT